MYSVGNSYLRYFVYCLLQNHICNTVSITKIWLLSLSTEKVIWKRRHTYTKPIKKYAHKSCNWRFQYSFSHQSLPIVPFFFFRREKILLGKRCRFHCSWKLVALSLTVLTLILSSVIAYFGGKLHSTFILRILTRILSLSEDAHLITERKRCVIFALW